MSYALETKKRKFHRVLDSLSKPPQAPDSSAKSSAAATATPRERTLANLSVKKVRLSNGADSEVSSARKSILKVGPSGSRVSSTSSTARPSFVPWDRERFLERLETFRRVDRWSPKPDAVNEVAWAKRGWICTDVSRVTCVGGCGGSVVVKLPDELDELDGYDAEKVQERKEVRAKLVEEYARLLTDGHVENCPWTTKGCDATIHRLPVSNSDTAIAGLRSRYFNLAKMGDKLPSNNIIRTPETLDLGEMMKILPEGFQEQAQRPKSAQPETAPGGESEDNAQPTETESSINETAFALAFFGWDTTSSETAGLAECAACFRRLGLWMYKPKENGAAPVYDTLEVANEHMEYCPWINGQAQSGTGKATDKPQELRSAWELLVQGLRVNHRRRTRASMSRDTSRAASETSSMDAPVGDEADQETRKESDKAWWAKIRRMRQMLQVKSSKRKSNPA
ncbi:hypothetical protein PHISP_07017 [Aspergillus sp. HF37]|nr:hypothetical protein PHISP_07017 [Aspergillus sp. HF37]